MHWHFLRRRSGDASPGWRNACLAALAAVVWGHAAGRSVAVQITVDYSLDAVNENWFGGTPAGNARRDALDAAAAFLSAIIIDDDWQPVAALAGTLDFTDIAASTIVDLAGNVLAGSPESDGRGYSYSVPISNRSSVAANEYVIYAAAFAYDFGTSALAKASPDGSVARNAAGVAMTEFTAWGGHVSFNTSKNWFAGLNPGIDPVDDYGVQDADKTPTSDSSADNWRWSTSSMSWKGFELNTLDATANNRIDLYGTALHELTHALGATTSNLAKYVGLNGGGNLVGANVVAEYGGPVPASGGHFAENVQSPLWGADEFLSEALLDPNVASGIRKYLTRIDAALLRDLGYEVLYEFVPGDLNYDALVNAGDLDHWAAAYGQSYAGDTFLEWQRAYAPGSAGPTTSTVSEIHGGALLAMGILSIGVVRYRTIASTSSAARMSSFSSSMVTSVPA